MQVGSRIRNILCGFVGCALVVLGFACMWTRSVCFENSVSSVCLAAAALALPDGDYYGYEEENETRAVSAVKKQQKADDEQKTQQIFSSGEVYSEDASQYDLLSGPSGFHLKR